LWSWLLTLGFQSWGLIFGDGGRSFMSVWVGFCAGTSAAALLRRYRHPEFVAKLDEPSPLLTKLNLSGIEDPDPILTDYQPKSFGQIDQIDHPSRVEQDNKDRGMR
jgi:hypothetical protein